MPARPLHPRHSAQEDKIPQLTCEACNERKVRCDKQSPCSTCKATGVICVPIHRRRLPRGRHVASIGAEDQSLRERVARLEGLIAIRDPDSADNPTLTAISASTSGIDSPPPAVTSASSSTTCPVLYSASTALQRTKKAPSCRYLANGFWNELVDKNPRLHGVLSDQTLESDHVDGNSNNNDRRTVDCSKQIPHHSSQSLQLGARSGILGLGLSHVHNLQSYVDAALALRPAPATCKKLCQAYLERVDPLVRVFHRPSLVAFLLDGKSYLHYHDTDPILDVLRSAVFFIAIVSLTEEQCRSTFDTDRASLIAIYRFACENALDRVGLITTEDISVVQSLVLYLFAVRTYDRSRTAWTLVSIAARLATALELNIDSNHISESFFEQQMRRRLWYAICTLDAQSSFDRASEPLIGHKAAHPQLPLNINDSEFGPDSEGSFADREGMTDMSKAIFHARLQTTGMALTFQDDLTPLSAQTMSKCVSHRQQSIEQFELHTRKLLQYCDPDSSPYAWCTFHGALNAPAVLQLALRRPMNYNGRKGIPVDPDPTKVLRLAATVLERDIAKRSDPRGEPFRWFGVVHWHPLAVAIAECYACDKITLLQQVWPTIEISFEYIGEILADYQQGMLWKPLERLMVRTRARVTALLGQSDQEISTGVDNSQPNTSISTISNSSVNGSTVTPSTSFSNPTGIPLTAVSAPFDLSPRPSETGVAQNNQWDWMMDTSADASLWQQMTSSMSDPGWDAWDDFINNTNLNTNGDMAAP